MSSFLQRFFISASLITVCTLPAHAEIYKWTDSSGKIHYSQTPPAQTQAAKNIKVMQQHGRKVYKGDEVEARNYRDRTPAEEDNDTAMDLADDPELQAAAEEGKRRLAEMKTYCNKNRSTLKQILSSPIIKVREGSGERTLSAKERTDKIDELNQAHKEHCSPEVLGVDTKKDTSDT